MSNAATAPDTGRTTFRFRRVRDFSECISDGFQFVREHRRTLYRPLVFICIPLKVVAAVLLASFFRSTAPGSQGGPSGYVSMFVAYLLIALSYFLATVVICEHMGLVMRGERRPTMGQVWRATRKNLLAYFAISLLTSLLMVIATTMAGFFAQLLHSIIASAVAVVSPLVFLIVVFQFSYPLRAFERASVGDCIGRAFKLSRGRWWLSFALCLTLLVLFLILNSAVDLPAILLSGFGSMSGIDWMNDPDGAGARYAMFLALTTLISSATAVLLLPFIQVPMGLHMLSCLERKEAPGLLEDVRHFNMDLPA